MKIDYEKLNEGLEKLTGYDYIACEKQARALGDMSPEMNFSKTFQAVLAAKALGCAYDKIAELKVSDYVKVTMTVANFILAGLGENEQERSTDEQP